MASQGKAFFFKIISSLNPKLMNREGEEAT